MSLERLERLKKEKRLRELRAEMSLRNIKPTGVEPIVTPEQSPMEMAEDPFAMEMPERDSDKASRELLELSEAKLRGVLPAITGVVGDIETLFRAAQNPHEMAKLVSGRGGDIETVFPTTEDTRPYTNALLDEIIGEADYQEIPPEFVQGAEVVGEVFAPVPPAVKLTKFAMDKANLFKAQAGVTAKVNEINRASAELLPLSTPTPQPPSVVIASNKAQVKDRLNQLNKQREELIKIRDASPESVPNVPARQAKKENQVKKQAIQKRIDKVEQDIAKAQDKVIAEFNKSEVAINVSKAINESKKMDEVSQAQSILYSTPTSQTDNAIEALVSSGIKREDAIRIARQADEVGEPLKTTRTTDPIVDNNQAVVTDRYIPPVTRGSGKTVGEPDSFFQKYLLPVTNRLGRISPEYATRIRKHEFDVQDVVAKDIRSVDKFTTLMEAVDPAISSKVLYNLSIGNYKGATEAARNSSELVTEINSLRRLLESKAVEARDAGVKFGYVEEYFPRLVRDFDGLSAELLKSTDSDTKSFVELAYEKYAKSKGITVDNMSSSEKDSVMNFILRGDPRFYKEYGLSLNNLRKRKLEDLSEDLFSKYYSKDVDEILPKYFSKMNSEIGLSRLFGAGAIDDATTFGSSLGKVVNTKNLSSSDIAELADVTQRYFRGTRKAMNSSAATLRDIGTVTTLGNVISAAKNLADIFNGVGRNGVLNTLGGMFDVVTKRGEMNLINTHLRDDKVRQLFSSESKLNGFRDFVLKASGFDAVERFNKSVFVNAALRKARDNVKSPEALSKFKLKWGDSYGKEFDNLVKDIKENNIDSPLLRFHMVNEATKIMPTSRLDLPISVADNPNTALLYQLKSYPLRQWATVGEDVVRQYKNGNKRLAVENALRMMGYLSASGLSFYYIGQLLRGRDIDANNVPEDVLVNLAGSFGASKYDFDRIARGDVTGTVAEYLMPAGVSAAVLPFVIGSEISKDDPDYEKAARKIADRTPIIGSPVSNFVFGGREAANERMQREIRKREREEYLD